MHLPLTAPQATQMAWTLALDISQDRANFMYPSEAKRIASGRKIIEMGTIQTHADHTATVTSQSRAGKTYTVNGACQCEAFGFAQDRGATSYRCAHRWAYLLYWKAIDRLTKISTATYTSGGDEVCGFAYALPEDSGYVFIDSWKGNHCFVTQQHTANLLLHGKCAWIEDGKVRGMVPQVEQDGNLLELVLAKHQYPEA